MTRKDNIIEKCYIKTKNKDTVFTVLKSGEIIVNLKGYAIIPLEELPEKIIKEWEEANKNREEKYKYLFK